MAGLANRSILAPVLSGAEFVSRLAPMKRILCLCPVLMSKGGDASLIQEGYERYGIGVAVSDPYLAYALPIDLKRSKQQGNDASTDGLYVYKGIGVSNKSSHPIYWKGMAPTREEFLKQIGYRDIGGLALALPMRIGETKRTELTDMKLDEARGSLRCVLNNFAANMGRTPPPSKSLSLCSSDSTKEDEEILAVLRSSEFSLQCDINESVTLGDAIAMARDEPEMWEECKLSNQESDNEVELSPSVHAAVALNAFLWKRTGGWRNTFA
mmetsp:Transcript_5039/g.10994  ORF Transcript_5039/g.10994 Transcript_5039/m.10994 type:complete len:268 (+) Transcript_5039:350-1153(+)